MLRVWIAEHNGLFLRVQFGRAVPVNELRLFFPRLNSFEQFDDLLLSIIKMR